MKTIKQIKLKSGDYGKWDYNSLVGLPDIPMVASGKIDELSIVFNSESSKLTVSNPGGRLNTEVDLSGLIRTGELESVELTGSDAIGNPGMYLKFTWRTGEHSNITYAEISRLYTEGRGIIITRAQDGIGNVISVNTSYIEELVEAKTTEAIQDYVTKAILEAKEKWLEL